MSKLLIVDDSAALLETLKYILERNGYTVKTLNNAGNIYKEIKEFHPDLLILDLFLNGEDVKEICKELRKGVENQGLRILMFSAFPRHLEDYKSYVDDIIEKPFELKNLMEKIKLLLHFHKSTTVS